MQPCRRGSNKLRVNGRVRSLSGIIADFRRGPVQLRKLQREETTLSLSLTAEMKVGKRGRKLFNVFIATDAAVGSIETNLYIAVRRTGRRATETDTRTSVDFQSVSDVTQTRLEVP